jgi:hypothetical protein
MSLFSFLNPAKDRALGVAVKLWFNQTHKHYGHMTRIHIDSTAKTIHVELELKGETAPLTIDVKSYSLSAGSGEAVIELGDIETSREWMNLLLAEYITPQNRRFPVPGAVRAIL